MLSGRLRVLEEQKEYIDALQVITDLQKPILSEIASVVKSSLVEFLPQIKTVTIDVQENSKRIGLRRDFDIIVDDGTPTQIEFKGDGVKSLATLAILKNKNKSTKSSIVAIEEPESHLHSGAIHQLNSIIQKLAETSQVILTTHNPLFINRRSLAANVIINKGQALAAKDIKQVRDILGIKASDNLINATYVLVVEGEGDAACVKRWLTHVSPRLKDVFNSIFPKLAL